MQAVGQTVQEFLNSDDSYTVCDNKGVAFADTPETRGRSMLTACFFFFCIPVNLDTQSEQWSMDHEGERERER